MNISIITATFNPGKVLNECIDSVIRNHAEEHRIQDNCSNDPDTIQILNRNKKFITLVSKPDQGIYDAMNRGCMTASGEILACLNADDRYTDNALDCVRQTFAEHPEADIVYGNIEVNGKIIRPDSFLFKFRNARIFHPACFMRKTLWEKLQGFDTQYHICADLDFFLRAKQSGAVFQYVDKPLAVFALGGISTANRKQAEQEVCTILSRHGFSSLYIQTFRCLNSIRAIGSKLLQPLLRRRHS